MGQIASHPPTLLLLGALSRYDEAIGWARRTATNAWGPVALASEPFPFEETDYYTPTMGEGLRMTFFAFERLVDPADLADVKRRTNRWEQEYAARASHGEPRPLNLDPGYLTLAKLVLASTKDHCHRIYLSGGIYAEVTLHFDRRRGWQSHRWTYPNYRREDYHRFFTRCRDYLRDRCEKG